MSEERTNQIFVGEILRYEKIADPRKPRVEELKNFHYVTHFEGGAMAQLMSGISPVAKVFGPDHIARVPVILVSSSPHKSGSHDTPWEDYYDPDNGYVRYYGDNKLPGSDPAEAPGNKALLNAFRLAHAEKDDRLLAPPIVFFERVTYRGKPKGYPRFQGLGVIKKVELVTQYDNKNDRTFTNYAFDFTILSLAHEHELFSWDWINVRRDKNISAEKMNETAPKAWRTFMSEGPNSLEKVRRRVAKILVTPKIDQVPTPGSETEAVLKEIYNFFGDKKHRFEGLAEIVAERVLGEGGVQYRKGWITQASGDQGTDFVASIQVGSGFSKSRLIVLGQAKCEKLDAPTGGNHIARTVARLRRGWVGVYVTTSYFSESVQQEVFEDKYPIVMIGGRRVAEEVRKIVQESDQFDSVGSYLTWVADQYPERIAQRRPEDLLYEP